MFEFLNMTLIEFDEYKLTLLALLNVIAIFLVVWVTHEAAQAPTRTKSAYFWAVDTALRAGGFEIPFPQRDLHLRSDTRHPKDDSLC